MPLDLKSTINLPKTNFPMKANLPQNEPKQLERWEQMGIYERIRQARNPSRSSNANRLQNCIVDAHAQREPIAEQRANRRNAPHVRR